jgi:hypothetical protein
MKRLASGLLSLSAGLLVGCDPATSQAAPPPIDKAAPAATQTATFALG